METVFTFIQLVIIPVMAVSMFIAPWIQSIYKLLGEIKSVIFLALILVILHIIEFIIADLTVPAAGLATFFSGIICFGLFILALILAIFAQSRHLNQKK
ncbi:MAG: hypothetical protein DHS20C07_26040 [Methyloligella sp.]|nr:MAG: hypothetical protein DHS20C07_26040 [Methyloligella sp.]